MIFIKVYKDFLDFASKTGTQNTDKTFHIFKPDKSKSPSKKKLNKLRYIECAGDVFEYSKVGGLRFKSALDDNPGRMICSHVPYVSLKCFEYDIRGERKSSIIWGIYSPNGEEIRSGITDLQCEKYLSTYLPHDVIVKYPKLFKQFLQLHSVYVPSINLYGYTGFILGKYEYIHSGGLISTQNSRNSRSLLPNGESKTLEYYKTGKKEKIETLENLLDLTPVTAIMLSFNLLSLTFSKYRHKSPQFIFELYGESGTFKSTISTHIFGIFKELYDHAPINLKVTSLSSIHNTLPYYRDCVLLNDDCAPSADGNKEMSSKIESLSRAYGDGTGRTVMSSVTKIHNTEPAGLSAVTAEFQPLRDTSDMARSVMYELKKGEIDSDKLTLVCESKHTYVSIITDYIEWICILKEKYMTELEKLFLEGCKKYYDLGSIHKRLPENFGWLYAGFNMFLKFAEEKYSISAKLTKMWYKIFKEAVEKSVVVQKAEMKTVDEAKLFISTIHKLIETKQANFAQIIVAENNRQIARSTPTTIGYSDDKYIYLLFDEAYGITNRWLHGIDSGYTLPKTALKSKLANKKYVITPKEGRLNSKITVNGKRIQVLKIKKKAIVEE